MTYHKVGNIIETKSGLKGKIISLDYREGKVYGVSVEVEESENYYKGERVHVLVSNIKN